MAWSSRSRQPESIPFPAGPPPANSSWRESNLVGRARAMPPGPDRHREHLIGGQFRSHRAARGRRPQRHVEHPVALPRMQFEEARRRAYDGRTGMRRGTPTSDCTCVELTRNAFNERAPARLGRARRAEFRKSAGVDCSSGVGAAEIRSLVVTGHSTSQNPFDSGSLGQL